MAATVWHSINLNRNPPLAAVVFFRMAATCAWRDFLYWPLPRGNRAGERIHEAGTLARPANAVVHDAAEQTVIRVPVRPPRFAMHTVTVATLTASRALVHMGRGGHSSSSASA